MASGRKNPGNSSHALFSIEPKSDKEKICAEFGFVLPEQFEVKSIYDNLMKERELFIAFELCAAVDDDDNGLSLIPKSWLPAILNEDSMDGFLDTAKTILDQHVSDPAALQKANKKIAKTFNQLIRDPSKLSDDDILSSMKILCRVNAHHSLALILSFHPNVVDIDVLLKEAIACLHTETVTTLIKLGADIHKPIRHSDYSDYGFQIYGPALFYAFMLPLEPYSVTGRFGPALNWDHPRYAKMLQCLLKNGANPDQNCIFTDPHAYEFDQAKQQEEKEDENCRVHASKMLANEDFKKEATPFFIQVVNEIVNWDYKPSAERRLSLG